MNIIEDAYHKVMNDYYDNIIFCARNSPQLPTAAPCGGQSAAKTDSYDESPAVEHRDAAAKEGE